MTVLIDPPNAAGHGRLWSHLASDASYDELHAFARTVGIPERDCLRRRRPAARRRCTSSRDETGSAPAATTWSYHSAGTS